MTTTQVTNAKWKRGVEDRYPGTNDASLSWGAYDRAVDGEFLSGMVVGIVAGTNEVRKANGAGGFHGIMFTENSDTIDESLGGAPPTVIVGGATLFIRKTALLPTASFAVGDYVTTSTVADEEGFLVDTATATGANIVGRVQEVSSDGIVMRLYPPTA
jgi:hypothetical protein